MSDPQANKQTAIDFYELMFNDNQPREAQERYTGADYRQHNPGRVSYPDRMAYPSREQLRKCAAGWALDLMSHGLTRWSVWGPSAPCPSTASATRPTDDPAGGISGPAWTVDRVG